MTKALPGKRGKSIEANANRVGTKVRLRSGSVSFHLVGGISERKLVGFCLANGKGL